MPLSGKCWEWEGRVESNGYAQAKYGGQRGQVHRLVYEALVGPIPDGLTLDHLCENKRCYNPAHLEPVTIAENIRRARAKITHCKRGHKLADENLYVTPDGRRNCRTCRREVTRRYEYA